MRWYYLLRLVAAIASPQTSRLGGFAGGEEWGPVVAQAAPEFRNSHSSSRQRRVLKAVEIPSVHTRNESSCSETKCNTWRQIVFAETTTELRIFLENRAD